MAVGYNGGTDDGKSIRALALDTVYRAVNRLPSGNITKAGLLGAIQAQFDTYIPGYTLPANSAST